MPRAKRTEKEIEVMRGRILEAALELLQQDGPQGVSIRKIADRIGVSHMLLYSYFENQASILQALRDRGFKEMEAFCTASLRRAENGDALVEVRALLGRFIQLSHEHPVLFQLAWRRDLSLQADSQNVRRIMGYLSHLIELCMERGQCVERDPALAAAMAFSIVNGTLLLYHNVAAIGQTAQDRMEAEMIEAAITYLTQIKE
jgi:AcrR family transcriptional regulator